MGRLVVLVVGLALTLSACTPEPTTPMPVPTVTPSSSSSAVSPDSIEVQKVLFDTTNNATVTRLGAAAQGRDFIDALVTAGFDKSAMQLTADSTAIGLKADNIQFSVQIDDECLVGQYGNVGYASAILPAVSTAGCLIGNTRAIDW